MPTPIQTVSYLKYLQPWLQSIGQNTKNLYQAGKTGAGNLAKKITHTPVQQKFKPEALDEIFSKIPSSDPIFESTLQTLRNGQNMGAPVTLKELQEIAAMAKTSPQLKHLEDVVSNYIRNSGITSRGLQRVGLNTQPTRWDALTGALQPGHTLKFDPLTRTLQAVDGTGQAVRRFSPAKTLGAAIGTGGTIYGGVEGVNAVSNMLEEKDITPGEYINSIISSPDFSSVSEETPTVDLPATDTPQTTENLPTPEQQPTPPVSSAEPPASAKVPDAAETTADTSFVDKALQWGKDNPDLVSLLSLLAVGAGGVGLYNLLDDDEEEDENEEEDY